MVERKEYYVLFIVDSCMGDKRNTQDINCGGLRKDTEFYSCLVWEQKKYTSILWWTEEKYYVLFMVDCCMGDKRNTRDIICGEILRFIHG